MIFKGNSGGLEPTNFFKPVASLFSQTAGLNDKQKEFYNDLTEAYKQNKKQADLLSDALEKLKEKYKGADLGISSYINSVGDGTITAEGFTESINNNTRAMLKNGFKAIGVNLAITAAISLIVAAYTRWKQKQEDMRRAAEDAAKEYADISDEIDSNIKKYQELNDVILDSSSTTAEVADAKDKLLSVQESILDKYGEEAEGLDLVNGKYEEQIGLLRTIQAEQARTKFNENREAYDNVYESMNKEYTPLYQSGYTYLSVNKALQDAIDRIDNENSGFTIQKKAASGTATMRLTTTVANGREELSAMYDEFEGLLKYVENDFERQFVEGMLNSISSALKEWDDKYSDDYSTYLSAQEMAVASMGTIGGRSTLAVYTQYAEAIANYNEALANGTETEIAAAKESLDLMKHEADGIVGLVGLMDVDSIKKDLFKEAFAELESGIDVVKEKAVQANKELDAMFSGKVIDFQGDDNTVALKKQFAEDTKEFIDASNAIDQATEKLADWSDKLSETGNVDILNRKRVDVTPYNVGTAREYDQWIKSGDYMTVLSSTYSDKKGRAILVTPILPDGTILSKDSFEQYISEMLDSVTDGNYAAWDEKGIVLGVFGDGKDMEANIAAADEAALAIHNLHETIISNQDEPLISDEALKNTLMRIKNMKMSQVEFVSYLHSDSGKTLFDELQEKIPGLVDILDAVIERMTQLGLFTDIDTPLSDDELDVYIKYADVIEDIVSGKKDYADLTPSEKAAIDAWIISAKDRNLTLEEYLKLCSDIYTLNMNDAVNKLSSANSQLVSKTEDVNAALQDMDTITDVVNGDMHLTDKQMVDLISRHSDLQSALRYTSNGWTLESDAMNVVEKASRSLESAYVTAQKNMTDLCNSGVGQRIKMYGIELQSMKSVMSAFSTGTNGLAKMTMASSVYNTEEGKSFAEAAMSAGNNVIVSSDNSAEKVADSWAIVNAYKWNKAIEEAEKALEGAYKAQQKVENANKKSGKTTEKYAAEIDKLYKSLEKQKEIEEDIADIQRKKDGLEDDDYSGRIKYIYKEIDATNRLNETLHEQNEIRRSMIGANIKQLQKYGFAVSYNASYNELLINNYEDLNTLVTAYAKKLGYGVEKTNDLIKAVEKLVSDTHDLNDANKDNSASWQDNTQAVKDYLKEIKKLKTEMVDAYLDKRNNYLSHMQDFELFNDFQSSDYLNGMLHDLEDFYNAGLLDYEEYVERHNEITKQLYDSRKDSLEYILDMVENMIKQELDDQVDALGDQKDALNDIIDMKKELISLAKEENDYNKSLKDKIKEMAKLQERIAQLELDDSREAAAEKASLIDQLADLQSEVDEMQHDKSIEMQESALDEMQEANEEVLDKQIQKIEDVANDAGKIHEMVVDKITNDWDTLYRELVDWNSIYGTGVEADIKGAWDNAIESLKVYKDHLGQITTAQAALGTVNPMLPDNSGSAGSVIADSNRAEISSIVGRMKEYASRWSRNNEDSVNKALEKAAFDESLKLPALGVVAERDPKTGKWIIQRDDNDPTNVGKVLYDVYHQGGTVGAKKDSEVFSLLEKGEDVLTKKQKFTAIPILKAGLQALNINENTAKILEALQNGARPSLAAMNNSEPSVVFNPEINIEVNAGNNSKEIATATKDAVWSAITEPFSKMGVSSKLRSIKV